MSRSLLQVPSIRFGRKGRDLSLFLFIDHYYFYRTGDVLYSRVGGNGVEIPRTLRSRKSNDDGRARDDRS